MYNVPPTYTNVEYSDMIEMFYTSGKSTVQTCRLYLQKFPKRRQPSRSTITNVVQTLKATGNIKNV